MSIYINMDNLFKEIQIVGSTKFCKDTGTSTGNISDWKSRRSTPGAKKLIEMADYFGCSIDYLLGHATKRSVNNYPDNLLYLDSKIVHMPIKMQRVSAGKGNLIDDGSDDVIEFTTFIVPPKTDYGIKISGDSMEPEIHNGELLWIQNTNELNPGEVGIILYNGEAYCKKYFPDRLISLNPRYKDIIFRSGDNVKVQGRVLKKQNLI